MAVEVQLVKLLLRLAVLAPLRVRGKRYTTHIERKSRAGKPVSPPASPR